MTKLFLFAMVFNFHFLLGIDANFALEMHKMNLEDRYDRLKDYCFSLRLSAYSCHVSPLKNNDQIRDHYYRERDGELPETKTERALSVLAHIAQVIGTGLSKKTNAYSSENDTIDRLTRDITDMKNQQNLSDCQVSCMVHCATKGLVSLAGTMVEFPYLFASDETILERGVGVCYNMAAIYSTAMKKLGYRSQVRASKENIHYYSDVELNGKTFIVDPTYSADIDGGACTFFSDSVKDESKLYSAATDLIEKKFKDSSNDIEDNTIKTDELKKQLENKNFVMIKGVNDLDDFNQIFDREFEKRIVENRWARNDEDKGKLKSIYDGMKIKGDTENKYIKNKYQFIQKSYFSVATKGDDSKIVYRYFRILDNKKLMEETLDGQKIVAIKELKRQLTE